MLQDCHAIMPGLVGSGKVHTLSYATLLCLILSCPITFYLASSQLPHGNTAFTLKRPTGRATTSSSMATNTCGFAVGLLQAADEVAVVLHGRALEGLAADAVALPRRDDGVGTPPGAVGVDREGMLVALGDAYPHTAVGTSTSTSSGIGVRIIIIVRFYWR